MSNFERNFNRLSSNVSISLKGISAIEIMIGHLGIETDYLLLYPSRKAGILFVGIFFMLSGYGLMHNYINKQNYFHNFLLKRELLIFIPAYLVYLLRGMFKLFQTELFEIQDICKYILCSDFYESTNWFVFEIAVFYMLFYIFYSKMNIRKANVSLIFIILIFILIAYVFRVDNPWYGSSLCFPLGIIYAQKEELWNRYLEEKYLVKNLLLVVFCGINILLFFILGNDSIVGNPLARNLAAGFFCLWVLSLIRKVRVEYKVFLWFGEISYEIFLLHLMWIDVLGIISNKLIYLVLVIGLTIISSWLIHMPLKIMEKCIKTYLW